MIDVMTTFANYSVKDLGSGKYQACCPVHEDKTPSLSISVNDKGVGIFCHAGCFVNDIVAVLGLSMYDLSNKSEQDIKHTNSIKRAVVKKDQFMLDYIIVRISNHDVNNGIKLSNHNRQIALDAYERLQKLNCNVDELYQKFLAEEEKLAQDKRYYFYLNWILDEEQERIALEVDNKYKKILRGYYEQF